MKKIPFLIVAFGLLCYTAFSQKKDTLLIEEVEISSSRTPSLYSETSRVLFVIDKKKIENAPVQSLNDLLKYGLNVDIRKRGAGNIQSDISIRGGSFEQTLILLNGIKVNDPQTGHHNLDLPIELKDIERIEILEGPGARIYGANAFSGAINIITKNGSANNLTISGDAGMYDLFGGAVSSEVKTKGYSHFLTINGNKCSGYIKNTDFVAGNFFYKGNYKTGNNAFELQIGYMDKAFGANSFYSPKYPDQYEHTKTKFTTFKYSGGKKVKFSPLIYWRRHNDKFELFRNISPAWYKNHNFHVTDVYGAEFNLTFLSAAGKTAVGLEYRNESIYSNVLGNIMDDTIRSNVFTDCFYNRYKTRLNSGLFIEQLYNYKNLTISGGLLTNWNSDYGIGLYPGIDISYKFKYQFLVFFSFNRTLRQPTFTDLYYQGPQNIGNPALKPEEALNIEFGVKKKNPFFQSSIAIFRRYAKNIIDWVKTNPTERWKSENLTNIISDGAELTFELNTDKLSEKKFPLTFIIFNYSYLNISKSSGDYISYYILDYLRNKATIQAQFRIYKTLGISLGFNYNDRAGTYLDFSTGTEVYYPDIFLLDTRIFYMIKGFEIYIDASNILNQQYYDYGNILMPGLWVKGGLSYTFNFYQNKK